MLLEVWNYIKIYLIHTVLIAGVAYAIMGLKPVDLAKFAGVTFVSLLLLEKIILKGISVVPSGGTVREQLVKACPKPTNAGNMIVPGNEATYDNYLFSACDAAGTCDGYNPDEISAGIIAKTEPCGAWDLKSTGLTYALDKGWTKESNCKQYTDDAAYLPDACLMELWSKTGCTNIAAADQNYKRWKKGTRKEVTRDMKSWANLQDTTHRTLCYGADQTKWPQPPPPPAPPIISVCGTGTLTGNGDYMYAQSPTAFAFGPGVDFTVEAWVNPTAYGNTVYGASIIGTANGATRGWSLNLGENGGRYRLFGDADGSWKDIIIGSSGIPLNVWTHVALVRAGEALTLYKNGVSVGTVGNAGSLNFTAPNNTGYLGLVNDGSNGPRYFSGTISNARVINGTAVYTTSTFTPTPAYANTVSTCTRNATEFYMTTAATPKKLLGNGVDQWTRLPSGGNKQVSRDGNVMCTVGTDNSIWCADQNVDTSPNWFRVPGGLTHVSVSNGRLYGVANGSIYYASDYKNAQWTQIPGVLTQVSLDGGVVCGINAGGNIACADQNIETNPNWFSVPGGLTYVSVKNGRLYGIGMDGKTIYYASNYKNAQWVAVPGQLSQVEFVDTGTVCGVNVAQQLWCADSSIETNPNWTTGPGQLSQVTGSNGKIVGVGSDQGLWTESLYS